MNNNKGRLNSGWLRKRGLFQDRSNKIHDGSGNFWGKIDHRGVVSGGTGNFLGRITRGGGFRR